MGTRVARETPKDLEKKKKKAAVSAADAAERSIRRHAEQSRDANRYSNILEAAEDQGELTYRPRTSETREAYELLLGSVHKVLGDQTEATVRSATDVVLQYLKSEDLKEFDRKKEVQGILGGILSDEIWSQFMNLSKKITDYGEEEASGADGDDNGGIRGRDVDGEEGVAVLFEDDDDEDEEAEDGFEVREDDESEEEDAGEVGIDGNGEQGSEEESDDDAMVIGTTEKKKARGKSDQVSPQEVDAFWLQRLITNSYPDPIQSNDLTTQALEFLSSEMDLRDLENSLAELFGYENFELVTILTKNRDTIVWCTKLARSNDDDKKDVEVAMREKGVAWILRALAGDSKQSGVTSNGDNATTKSALSKGNAVPSTMAQPRRTVDIDSLMFAQGGHLMSNKKVKLPQGSFKRTGKGFEEIHVPTPEKKPVAADEVPVRISSLPSWTHPVWGTTPSLNRIQSKVYPCAFQSDEPMLLCAPTGAGKVSLDNDYANEAVLTASSTSSSSSLFIL